MKRFKPDHLIKFERIISQRKFIWLVLYNPFSKAYDDLYELDLIISDWNKSGEKIITQYDSAYFIQNRRSF